MTDLDDLLAETLDDLASAQGTENKTDDHGREESDETNEICANEEDSVAANIARTLEALRTDANPGGDDDDAAEAAFTSFFTSLTAGVCSRDVLLDPITVLLRDFQVWMAKNEAYLSAENKLRYHKQIALYLEIQALLANEQSAGHASRESPSTGSHTSQPSTDKPTSTAQRVQNLLLELQRHGSPPPEVMADLPPCGENTIPSAAGSAARATVDSSNDQQTAQSDDFTLEDSKGFSDFLKAFGFEGEGLNPSHLTPEVLDKLARGEMASQEVTALMGRLTLDDQTFANVAKVAQDAAGEPNACNQQ